MLKPDTLAALKAAGLDYFPAKKWHKFMREEIRLARLSGSDGETNIKFDEMPTPEEARAIGLVARDLAEQQA